MKSAVALSLSLLLGGAAFAGDLGGLLAPLERPRSAGGQAAGSGAAPMRGAARVAAAFIEEKDVLAALERELTNQLSLTGELRLSFGRAWAPIPVSEGARWTLRLTQVPAGGLSPSSLVRFEIESEGKVVGDWQMSLRAQLWRPVCVTGRRLDRGQTMDSSLCVQQTVDVLREKQAVVPVETDLANYELAQTISQDRPLTWRDLVAKPLVRKGQIVDVTVKDGAMNIAMKGMAMASGGAGESILVRNLDSRKDFTAKVLRSNTVQVAF
jgi:flagella basal body P-ring formation protein FlgA